MVVDSVPLLTSSAISIIPLEFKAIWVQFKSGRLGFVNITSGQEFLIEYKRGANKDVNGVRRGSYTLSSMSVNTPSDGKYH